MTDPPEEMTDPPKDFTWQHLIGQQSHVLISDWLTQNPRGTTPYKKLTSLDSFSVTLTLTQETTWRSILDLIAYIE